MSSSEIAAALGMKSNLVAFHTNVLHERGIVRRVRSEFDGRRTYLQLIPDAFSALAADPTSVGGRVVFVCTANSARSQLAQAIWADHSGIPAASAGMHPADRVNPGTIDAATRHGISLDPDAGPERSTRWRAPRLLDQRVRPGARADEGPRRRALVDPRPREQRQRGAFDRTVSELRARIARVAAQLVAA